MRPIDINDNESFVGRIIVRGISGWIFHETVCIYADVARSLHRHWLVSLLRPLVVFSSNCDRSRFLLLTALKFKNASLLHRI